MDVALVAISTVVVMDKSGPQPRPQQHHQKMESSMSLALTNMGPLGFSVIIIKF
jgi:hypothetical protein